MTTEVTQEVEQGNVQSNDKAPYTMLEILIYGTEDKKKQIKKMMDKLQLQMAELKKGKYCRILWYIDKGEKTDDEKKQWLLDNTNAKYYVFTPTTYLVKPKYVSNLLIQINKYETAVKKMKELQVVPTKKQNVQNNSQTN